MALNILTVSVHVKNNSLATVLSLKDVNNITGVHVTMNTLIEKSMSVILGDGVVFKFNKCGLVLYYYDIASNDE